MSKKLMAISALGAALTIVGAGFAGMMTARGNAAEPKYEEQIGGGAPVKVLQDNDVLRATLISFPKGQVRQGGVKRKLDQVLIYIDDAKFSHLPTPGTQFDKESQTVMKAGQITYHDKDTVVGTLRVDEPYRVMYVEIKRPKPVSK
jgi:hypothetical protein